LRKGALLAIQFKTWKINTFKDFGPLPCDQGDQIGRLFTLGVFIKLQK
jgi:hypothetical protein